MIADGEIHDKNDEYCYILYISKDINVDLDVETLKKNMLEKYVKYIIEKNVEHSEFSFCEHKSIKDEFLSQYHSYSLKFKKCLTKK